MNRKTYELLNILRHAKLKLPLGMLSYVTKRLLIFGQQQDIVYVDTKNDEIRGGQFLTTRPITSYDGKMNYFYLTCLFLYRGES